MSDLLDGFHSTQEDDATSVIRTNCEVYGSDVLTTKFPNYVDGLKDVTRRIVWLTRDKKDKIPFNKALGDIMESHVGGDASIYEAMIRLGQIFQVGHPLITIYGKQGSYYDPKSAAQSRYLYVSISEFATDVYFKDIHLKTIPMKYTKNFASLEPKYLIPKIPMALVLGNLTVGYGFKSHISMIDFSDVCSLTQAYAEHQSKSLKPINYTPLIHYFIPSFPIDIVVRNQEELLAAYKQGDWSCGISMEGLVELTGNTVTLRSVPYGIDFGTVTRMVTDALKDRKHPLLEYVSAINNYSSNRAEFVFDLKKGVNPFMCLDKIKSLTRFTRKLSPIYSYMQQNDKVVTLTPPELLAAWYRERRNAVSGGLKYRQHDLIAKKMTYLATLCVVDHTDEVIDIIRHTKDTDTAIAKLQSKFHDSTNPDRNLTRAQARILVNLPLNVLTHANKQQLLRNIEQVNKDLKTTIDDFARIDEIIYNDAAKLKKTYTTTRASRVNEDYIACIQYGNLGVTRVFTHEELYDLLTTKGWPAKLTRTIHMCPKYSTMYYLQGNNLVAGTSAPKDITTTDIVVWPNICKYSLVIHEDTVSVINRRSLRTTIVKDTTVITYPITDTFIALHKRNKITLEHVADVTTRKTISRGSKSDILAGYPAAWTKVLVFHMHPSEKNNIYITYIDTTSKVSAKTCFFVGGYNYILDIVPVTDTCWYLNIPKECNSNSVDYVYIPSLTKLATTIQPNTFKVISTTKQTTKHTGVRSLGILDKR